MRNFTFDPSRFILVVILVALIVAGSVLISSAQLSSSVDMSATDMLLDEHNILNDNNSKIINEVIPNCTDINSSNFEDLLVATENNNRYYIILDNSNIVMILTDEEDIRQSNIIYPRISSKEGLSVKFDSYRTFFLAKILMEE